MIDQYLIVLEKSETGFSAYSPDVVGCIATGASLEETTEQMRSALALHLANIEDLPKPRGIDTYLEALSDSEGETFYLTHVLLESIVNHQQEMLIL
jgi:predicted RNase H-like HicB family nuclease